MRKVFQKLHSTRGASLLVALLFLAVCLTVGSLLLAAATADTVKLQGRVSDERAYLAVSSAARLLKEKLGKCTYTAGRTRQPEDDSSSGTGSQDGWQPVSPAVSPAGGDLLTAAYADMTAKQTESYQKTFAVKADAAHADVPDVSADLQMKSGGDAVLVLTCGGSSVKISFPARTASVTDGESYDYTTTSWSAGVISKGGAS